MTDKEKREKVIKGLECCLDALVQSEHEFAENGIVMSSWQDRAKRINAIREAIAFLKAQEPVEPILDIDEWKCGSCGHALEHQELLGDNVLFHEQYNYCPECGRMVKRG